MTFNRTISIFLTILIAIEIFYFSTISTTGGSGGIAFAPVAYHFIVFFLFAFFLGSSIVKDKVSRKQILLLFALSLVYAISDEIHQIFVPLRDASIRDILTDSIGISLGLLALVKIKSSSKNRTKN